MESNKVYNIQLEDLDQGNGLGDLCLGIKVNKEDQIVYTYF